MGTVDCSTILVFIYSDMMSTNSAANSLLPIGSVFTQLEMSYKWQKSSQARNRAIPQHQNVRHHHGNRPDKKLRKQANKNKEAETSDQDGNCNNSSEDQPPRIRRNKRLIRRCLLSSSRFQESFSRQDSLVEENEQDVYAMLIEVKKDPKHCSCQDLCSLILNLLQSLCLLDLDQVSLIKVISPAILPHLLHLLTGMYPSATNETEDLLAMSWKKDDSVLFQRQLLRVILSLCGIISTQQNGVSVILGHKVTAVLLDVAQQVHHFQEIKVHLSMSNQQTISPDTHTLNQEFCLFAEINIGLLLCFDMIFQNLPFNLVYIKNAVQLVEDFGCDQGFTFLECVIKEYDKQQSDKVTADLNLMACIDVEPVKVISCFLNTLKSVKVNYIHSVSCLKRKHQKCYYGAYFDHHHDILGQPLTQDSESKLGHSASTQIPTSDSPVGDGACLVASWCSFLLSLLPKVKSKVTQVDMLSTLHLSAMCCCMSLETVVAGITVSMKSFVPAVQSYALETLNTILLYPYLGGLDSMKTGHRSGHCSSQACQKYIKLSNAEFKSEKDNFSMNFDSGFSSRDMSKKNIYSPDQTSRWSALDLLKAVLVSPNARLSELTAKHLQVLAIGAKPDLKEELFFRVYLQAFQSFIGTWGKSSQSSSEEGEFVQFSLATRVHCLSALPYLLQVDSVLKVFLTKHGLGQICRLLEDDGLREPTLRVFEALVLLDENRLKSKVCDVADSEVLVDGMVIKAFIDGLAVKTKGDINKKSLWPGVCPGSVRDVPSSAKTSDSSAKGACIKNLALMVDMWETCSKLCINSDEFVVHFKDSDSLKIAEDTLIVILQQMYSPVCELSTADTSEDSGQECVGQRMPRIGCFMWLSLLKALLVVCSACYKNHGRQVRLIN